MRMKTRLALAERRSGEPEPHKVPATLPPAFPVRMRGILERSDLRRAARRIPRTHHELTAPKTVQSRFAGGIAPCTVFPARIPGAEAEASATWGAISNSRPS